MQPAGAEGMGQKGIGGFGHQPAPLKIRAEHVAEFGAEVDRVNLRQARRATRLPARVSTT